MLKFVVTLSALLLFFSGCAGSLSSAAAKPETAMTSDKTKAYVMFSRPEMIGMALSNTIVEFDPRTFRTRPIGTLAYETRIIYETTPGTHYFYMDGGENDDMLKMTLEAGKIYYVHTPPSMGVVAGRFYFVPLRYRDYLAVRDLKSAECDEAFLKEYGFEPIENEASSFAQTYDYHSDSLKADITCRNGKVTHAHSYYDLDELRKAKLVVPNEKAREYYEKHKREYESEIKEDFSKWSMEDADKTAVKPEDGFPVKL